MLESSYTQRGAIEHRDCASQIRDFTGLLFGNITPTDIDALIEYKNKAFIFIEAKYMDAKMPYGQRLALERLCNSLDKPSMLLVTEHYTKGDIDFANSTVREYYYKGKWLTPRTIIKLRGAIEIFLNSIGIMDDAHA